MSNLLVRLLLEHLTARPPRGSKPAADIAGTNSGFCGLRNSLPVQRADPFIASCSIRF
jgi:hypothetical protein